MPVRFGCEVQEVLPAQGRRRPGSTGSTWAARPAPWKHVLGLRGSNPGDARPGGRLLRAEGRRRRLCLTVRPLLAAPRRRGRGRPGRRPERDDAWRAPLERVHRRRRRRGHGHRHHDQHEPGWRGGRGVPRGRYPHGRAPQGVVPRPPRRVEAHACDCRGLNARWRSATGWATDFLAAAPLDAPPRAIGTAQECPRGVAARPRSPMGDLTWHPALRDPFERIHDVEQLGRLEAPAPLRRAGALHDARNIRNLSRGITPGSGEEVELSAEAGTTPALDHTYSESPVGNNLSI